MRAPVGLGARLGGASRYLTAVVEQGLFSLLNLGVVLALGRLMSPEQFGDRKSVV